MTFQQYKIWVLFKIKSKGSKIVRGTVLLFSHSISIGDQFLRFWGREIANLLNPIRTISIPGQGAQPVSAATSPGHWAVREVG